MPAIQLPLIPAVPFVPPPEFHLLFQLLRNATSGGVVAEFLKKKNLPYSGTWDELRDKRILPALERHELTMEDLTSLLSECEEHGGAHTLLFKCSKNEAEAIISGGIAKAQSLGMAKCVGPGAILDMPTVPTIAAVRQESDGVGGKALVIKIVEQREVRGDFTESTEQGFFVQKWKLVKARAVNVIRLVSSGLLEVRIASHDSADYGADVTRIWTLAEPIIPRQIFDDFSLEAAKTHMVAKRDELNKVLRFGPSTARTNSGASLSAAPKVRGGDIFEDQKVAKHFGAFCGGAHLESSNVHWLPSTDGLPSSRIRMILPETWNEFAITAHCSKSDYEYVLNKLRTFSS